MHGSGGPIPSIPGNPAGPAHSPLPLSGQAPPEFPEHPAPGRGKPDPWLIVLAVGGLALGGFGLVKSLMNPKPRVVQLTTPAQPSFFSEQTKMMREALDMAKEAQAMQRDHMQLIQEQMEAAYEGDAPPPSEDGGGL